MSTVLTLLALAGIAAAAWHLVRAAFRFLRHGAAGYWTEEMARTHARRGDVTALEDAKRDRRSERRSKRRAGLRAVGWLALLVAPSLTPWARPIYATYAAFWAVPVARRRGGSRRGRDGKESR